METQSETGSVLLSVKRSYYSLPQSDCEDASLLLLVKVRYLPGIVPSARPQVPPNSPLRGRLFLSSCFPDKEARAPRD